MPNIEIRPAIVSDIDALIALEHNYTSDYVWQMNFSQEDEQVEIRFREIRLPRSIQVAYPNDPQELADSWTARDALIVAVMDGEAVGYISLDQNTHLQTTRVTDLTVTRHLRRKKIGSTLVIAAQEWAVHRESQRIILEFQPKNYPAIQMARRLGFELCGYHDHYFSNHDIAIFFSKWVR